MDVEKVVDVETRRTRRQRRRRDKLGPLVGVGLESAVCEGPLFRALERDALERDAIEHASRQLLSVPHGIEVCNLRERESDTRVTPNGAYNGAYAPNGEFASVVIPVQANLGACARKVERD